MAVLLAGRQCCVSRWAMERYDARFCRNSVMTSFAGSKSWNFCGRRGVNSSTALRTVAGSNEDIGWNDADMNRETGRREHGHDDAAARTVLCLSRFTANLSQQRDCGRGPCETSDCLRTVCDHRQCLFANGCVSCAFGDADCLLPRLMAWTGRDCGLFADTDQPQLRPVLCQSMFADLLLSWLRAIHIPWLFCGWSATALRTWNPSARRGNACLVLNMMRNTLPPLLQQLIAPVLQLLGDGLNAADLLDV